jgi:hypothetical protein
VVAHARHEIRRSHVVGLDARDVDNSWAEPVRESRPSPAPLALFQRDPGAVACGTVGRASAPTALAVSPLPTRTHGRRRAHRRQTAASPARVALRPRRGASLRRSASNAGTFKAIVAAEFEALIVGTSLRSRRRPSSGSFLAAIRQCLPSSTALSGWNAKSHANRRGSGCPSARAMQHSGAAGRTGQFRSQPDLPTLHSGRPPPNARRTPSSDALCGRLRSWCSACPSGS